MKTLKPYWKATKSTWFISLIQGKNLPFWIFVHLEILSQMTTSMLFICDFNISGIRVALCSSLNRMNAGLTNWKLQCRWSFNSRILLSRSCLFIDGNGGTHEVDFEDMNSSKLDRLGDNLITNMIYYMDCVSVLWPLKICRHVLIYAVSLLQHLCQHR